MSAAGLQRPAEKRLFYIAFRWTKVNRSAWEKCLLQRMVLDYAVQMFIMSGIALFSTSFWNEYHSRHHSKPNLVRTQVPCAVVDISPTQTY